MNLQAKLSKREIEVAKVMAFTKSKSDAANKLCISEGTLAAYTYRIYDKLDINSKSELVIWWMVTMVNIEKDLIPYFKLIPILILSYGIAQEHTMICRSVSRRFEVQKVLTTSK